MPAYVLISELAHLPWCRICASMKWVNLGSGNGLSPNRRQAITWTNADLLSTGPFGTNDSVIWIEMQSFSFIKMHSKMSVKWLPCYPGRDELRFKMLFKSCCRADSRFVPSQWETSLLCNDVSLAGRKSRISPVLIKTFFQWSIKPCW